MAVLLGELNRIQNRHRPRLAYVPTEDFLCSRPLVEFDDEAKHIRAEADRLMRYVYTNVPHETSRLPVRTITAYDRYAPEGKYVSRYSDIPTNIQCMSYYTEPSRATIGRGHLACVSYAGGRGYPRRKHLYNDENRDIGDEIKFRSYYLRNSHPSTTPRADDALLLPTGFASRILLPDRRLLPGNEGRALVFQSKLIKPVSSGLSIATSEKKPSKAPPKKKTTAQTIEESILSEAAAVPKTASAASPTVSAPIEKRQVTPPPTPKEEKKVEEIAIPAPAEPLISSKDELQEVAAAEPEPVAEDETPPPPVVEPKPKAKKSSMKKSSVANVPPPPEVEAAPEVVPPVVDEPIAAAPETPASEPSAEQAGKEVAETVQPEVVAAEAESTVAAEIPPPIENETPEDAALAAGKEPEAASNNATEEPEATPTTTVEEEPEPISAAPPTPELPAEEEKIPEPIEQRLDTETVDLATSTAEPASASEVPVEIVDTPGDDLKLDSGDASSANIADSAEGEEKNEALLAASPELEAPASESPAVVEQLSETLPEETSPSEAIVEESSPPDVTASEGSKSSSDLDVQIEPALSSDDVPASAETSDPIIEEPMSPAPAEE